MISLSFNAYTICLPSKDTLPTKGTPFWALALTTPTVEVKLNETDEYIESQYGIHFQALTVLSLDYSDKGSWMRFSLAFLGFGFSISRQDDF